MNDYDLYRKHILDLKLRAMEGDQNSIKSLACIAMAMNEGENDE
jgi:hypothetical protein